jgi:PAS domain S-box-containing protein
MEEEDQILAHIRSGEPVEHFETVRRCKDGQLLTISLTLSPVRDQQGRIIGASKIARDITERKRDELAISEGEQRLRVAKYAAKLGIYKYDVATGAISWDARVRQIWGVEPDVPVTIDTFFSGLHPQDRARTEALLERALDPAGKGEYSAEYRVISHSDGSERWVAATGQVFFENGRPRQMIGAGQDISERKRAEAALSESEERFRFAQKAAGIGTFDWNIETGVNTWTRELEAIYGLPPGGFPGTQEAYHSRAPVKQEVFRGSKIVTSTACKCLGRDLSGLH